MNMSYQIHALAALRRGKSRGKEAGWDILEDRKPLASKLIPVPLGLSWHSLKYKKTAPCFSRLAA